MDDSIQVELLQEWVAVSAFLSWFVLVVSAVTVPLLLTSLCAIDRRSHYFPYLAAIVIGNTVMLCTMSVTLVLENYYMDTIGSLVCKSTSFATGVSACFVNWTWVVMYLQRCICIFCPLRRQEYGVVKDSRKLLMTVGAIAIITQLWTPVLITENTVTVGESQGAYCGQDSALDGSILFQTVAIMESMFTFAFPFLLTVITDISIFFCQSGNFTVISVERLRTESVEPREGYPLAVMRQASYLKIVSEKCILSYRRRRLFAIRRCLIMATLTLSLNLPHFALQMADEFFQLRNASDLQDALFYLKADAIVYVLYLLQFPIVPVYVYLLKSDFDRSYKKPIQREHRTVEHPSFT